MGTNYYWREAICGSCGRYNEIHVGKASGTWRAYPHEFMNNQYPEWGYDPESPFGFPVLTMEDWRKVFKTRPGELWTEYKEQIENPLEWLAKQKPWEPHPLYERRYLDEDIRSGRGWLDGEGFKFYSGEFS